MCIVCVYNVRRKRRETRETRETRATFDLITNMFDLKKRRATK